MSHVHLVATMEIFCCDMKVRVYAFHASWLALLGVVLCQVRLVVRLHGYRILWSANRQSGTDYSVKSTDIFFKWHI